MNINHARIATNRLREIRRLRRHLEFLKADMERVLVRELETLFHAYCVERRAYADKLHAIAKSVSEHLFHPQP